MAYDIKITGGTLIDGTGAPPRRADVAVAGGRVVAVGDCPDGAGRIIDAEGAMVTPGFVDIHGHYDGQVSWDGDLLPSSRHGVTTCVLGNCGVGFAPVREGDQARLIQLMEGVEDIPGTALAEGITWEWESFPEYMAAVDRKPHTMDLVLQVPHDAVRVYVMGERAAALETATEEDIAAMRRVVAEALAAGAAGFSTGRTDNHRAADGSHTPAAEANERELVGIAGALREQGRGVLQVVSDFDMTISEARFDAEFDLIDAMAEAAGRPLSLSVMQRDQAPRQWEQIIARVERADARGLTMRMQVAPRAIGVMLGLEATFHPFMGFPTYKRIAHLPLAERVARLRDPAVRAQILSEKSDRLSGDGSPIPPLADLFLQNLDMIAFRLYRLGERPDYEPPKERCLYNVALQRGQTILEALYDAMLEEEGRALLYFPLYNYTELNLDNVRRMMDHPLSLPGLADGGAHVGTVCDASMPTFLLTHWGRDRAEGRFPLERLVKMQAHDTARHMGLRDRGVLAPGMRADINVIDMERLALEPPRMQADLPAGGRRLVQGARGYRATLVAGEVVLEEDRLTGARPGRVVRV